ncbi:MAG: GmrSD restriction endonuclease domain-containing protein [Candidatus Puniceispirillaceae bacterium]
MEITIRTDITLRDIHGMYGKKVLIVNSEYQRGEAWRIQQKQMFIDSLLRGYHAPAFYFHYKQTVFGELQNNFIEIIDGQQRVNAISGFLDDGFVLLDPNDDRGFRFPNFVKGLPCLWGGKRFSELDPEIQNNLVGHKVVAYGIKTDDDNEVRDLFIRLQAGVPLTPQDKRDAWPGNFTEFVLTAGGKTGVDKWHGWDFFNNYIKISNQGQRRMLVAQSYMTFHAHHNYKNFKDIKSSSLDQFYHDQIDFDKDSDLSKTFKRICDVLSREFNGHPKLIGHHTIHLILLVDGLLKDYTDSWRGRLANALAKFKQRCEEGKKVDKEGDYANQYFPYFQRYVQWTSRSSDTSPAIRSRHAFFVEKILEILNVTPKDTVRNFTDMQREAIYYGTDRKCEVCLMNGESSIVEWDDAEFHHITPHSQGGATGIENCALVHKSCHPRSSGDVATFKEWRQLKKHKQNIQSDTKPQRTTKRNELPPDGTYLRVKYWGDEFTARIDGREVVLDHNSSRHKSLSTAAFAITGNSVNGWRWWEIKLPNTDEWIVATSWRDS